MSIDGRITVDALFHDRSDADSRIKIIALQSSTGYASGEIVHVTGTAGTSAQTLAYNAYRNAAGNLVSLTSQLRIAFSWSGSSRRILYDSGADAWKLHSSNGEVAVTQMPDLDPILSLSSGVGTGTYSIVMWGPE